MCAQVDEGNPPLPQLRLPVPTTVVTSRMGLSEKNKVESRRVVKAAEQEYKNTITFQITVRDRVSVTAFDNPLPSSFPGSKVAKVFFRFDLLLLCGHESIGMSDLLAYVLEVLFHDLDSFSVVSECVCRLGYFFLSSLMKNGRPQNIEAFNPVTRARAEYLQAYVTTNLVT